MRSTRQYVRLVGAASVLAPLALAASGCVAANRPLFAASRSGAQPTPGDKAIAIRVPDERTRDVALRALPALPPTRTAIAAEPGSD